MNFKNPYDELIEKDFLYIIFCKHFKDKEGSKEIGKMLSKHLKEFKDLTDKQPELKEDINPLTKQIVEVYEEELKEVISERIRLEKK